MSKHIRAYWFQPPRGGQNLGDVLASILLATMGYTARREGEGPCLFSIGTLFSDYHYRHAGSNHIVVWGSGAGKAVKDPSSRRLDIRAVRGPLTRRLFDLPEDAPLGDPALLLPHLSLSLPSVGASETLWVPHWTNTAVTAPDGSTAMQPTYLPPSKRSTTVASVTNAVARIASAKFVLAESLHAAILAHAYGVPWAPVTMPEDRLEALNLFKWSDWFAYLGLSDPPVFYRDARQAREWWDRIGRHRVTSDPKVLLDVFPSELAAA